MRRSSPVALHIFIVSLMSPATETESGEKVTIDKNIVIAPDALICDGDFVGRGTPASGEADWD